MRWTARIDVSFASAIDRVDQLSPIVKFLAQTSLRSLDRIVSDSGCFDVRLVTAFSFLALSV
jgi:hypothetical protein